MYFLYDLAMLAALAVILPGYFFRLKVKRKRSLGLRQRLGKDLPVPDANRPFVWIHAVSVGEVLSLQSLTGAVRAAHPEWEIGVSVLTQTGYDMAREKIRASDHVFYLPFDLGLPVRRVFARLRPALLVLAESEYWPRLLREADRRGCPVLVVNGRMSDRTFRRMKKLRPIASRLLARVARFLAQTQVDRDRLEKIGVAPEKIQVAGNLKCETRLPVLSDIERAALKKELGLPDGNKVIVAGSIHPGEESLLLRAFHLARRRRPDIRLILAPRHPEKFAGWFESQAGTGLVVRKRTDLDRDSSWDILLLDTIGELARMYAVCDVAFVGGSLIPWGGQNLLEPAFYGKPFVFGPYMKNFADLAEAFVRGGGAQVVRTPEEIAAIFGFADPAGLEEMGRKAGEILASLQGATERTLRAMESLMEKRHV